MKSYTKTGYERKVIEANKQGKMLYIMRKPSEVAMPESEDSSIVSTSPYYIDTLEIAPVNYYICMKDNITDGTINPNYEKEEKAKKQAEIDNLHVTPLDFLNMIKKVGVTDEQIEDFLNNNLAVKHQLTFCNHVYCGVVKAMAPIEIGGIRFTAKQIEKLFTQET